MFSLENYGQFDTAFGAQLMQSRLSSFALDGFEFDGFSGDEPCCDDCGSGSGGCGCGGGCSGGCSGGCGVSESWEEPSGSYMAASSSTTSTGWPDDDGTDPTATGGWHGGVTAASDDPDDYRTGLMFPPKKARAALDPHGIPWGQNAFARSITYTDSDACCEDCSKGSCGCGCLESCLPGQKMAKKLRTCRKHGFHGPGGVEASLNPTRPRVGQDPRGNSPHEPGPEGVPGFGVGDECPNGYYDIDWDEVMNTDGYNEDCGGLKNDEYTTSQLEDRCGVPCVRSRDLPTDRQISDAIEQFGIRRGEELAHALGCGLAMLLENLRLIDFIMCTLTGDPTAGDCMKRKIRRGNFTVEIDHVHDPQQDMDVVRDVIDGAIRGAEIGGRLVPWIGALIGGAIGALGGFLTWNTIMVYHNSDFNQDVLDLWRSGDEACACAFMAAALAHEVIHLCHRDLDDRGGDCSKALMLENSMMWMLTQRYPAAGGSPDCSPYLGGQFWWGNQYVQPGGP